MSAAEPRMPAAHADAAVASSDRAAGWWGLSFVVLLLLSAGMASVPQATDAPAVVRHFYTAHTTVVVVSQVVSLLASAGLVAFVLTLRRGVGPRRSRMELQVTGLVMAGVSVLTAVPVLWLCAVAGTASDSDLHGLTVLCDLADVLLFLAIAVWAGALVHASSGLAFRVLAGIVAVLSLVRALLLLGRSTALELVGPLGFVVLVVVVSVLVLLRRSPLREG